MEMSSDESDSSKSSTTSNTSTDFYPSDDDTPCSPVALEAMSSSSNDADDPETTCAPYLFLRVKDGDNKRSSSSRFAVQTIKDDLLSLFEELVRSDDDVKYFPETMHSYLSKKHPKVEESLQKLEYDEFFICIGKTLVVTLNIDNPRLRIPRSLICDVCVFSNSKPVLVISFVTAGYKPKRLDIYNTYIARGVTEALGTFSSDNISVVKGVIEEGSDVSSVLPKLQACSSFFQVASSMTMCQEKATTAAKALLRSIAVSEAHALLYPELSGSIWFLTCDEFEYVTNTIDMETPKFEHSTTGDRNLLALEMGIRRSKQETVALLVSLLYEKLTPDKLKRYTNLDLLEAVSQMEKPHSPRYTFVIADSFKHIKSPVTRLKACVLITSASKSDAKAVKKINKQMAAKKPNAKQETKTSLWSKLFKKKNKYGSVDIAAQSEGVVSQSTPNLASFKDAASSDEEERDINISPDRDLKSPTVQLHEPPSSVSASIFGQLKKGKPKPTNSKSELPDVEGMKRLQRIDLKRGISKCRTKDILTSEQLMNRMSLNISKGSETLDGEVNRGEICGSDITIVHTSRTDKDNTSLSSSSLSNTGESQNESFSSGYSSDNVKRANQKKDQNTSDSDSDETIRNDSQEKIYFKASPSTESLQRTTKGHIVN